MSASLRLACASLLIAAATATAQDSLGSVRDLYASAEYEEALTALGRLKAEGNSAVVEIDRYRVLCLIALGRSSEADRVIESIVTSDPLYQPAAADAAPRVRTAFNTVRQRMLPGVARTLYVDAKAAFDRKAFPEAVEALDKTVRVIDSIEAPARADLGDLRVLASGFLELSRASLAPPAPPPAAASASAPSAAANSAEPAPVPAPRLATTHLVVLRQDVPPLPFSLSMVSGEYRGAVEVDIDDRGNVVNAVILQPIHAVYDPLLLKAASQWKYEPPRIAGKPIPSRKRVEIVLRP